MHSFAFLGVRRLPSLFDLQAPSAKPLPGDLFEISWLFSNRSGHAWEDW